MSDAFGGYPACCFVAVIAVYGVIHHSISILGGTIGGRARVRERYGFCRVKYVFMWQIICFYRFIFLI